MHTYIHTYICIYIYIYISGVDTCCEQRRLSVCVRASTHVVQAAYTSSLRPIYMYIYI